MLLGAIAVPVGAGSLAVAPIEIGDDFIRVAAESSAVLEDQRRYFVASGLAPELLAIGALRRHGARDK